MSKGGEAPTQICPLKEPLLITGPTMHVLPKFLPENENRSDFLTVLFCSEY
jgi:hypothetical protein